MAKTAAQHFNTFHKAAHEYHSKMIEAHRGMLKKAEDESDRAFHEAAIAAHASMQFVHHHGIAQTAKAAEEDELYKSNELVPTQVSGVIDPGKGPRAVIRPGQREISGTGAMPVGAEGFEGLVKVGDDSEETWHQRTNLSSP